MEIINKIRKEIERRREKWLAESRLTKKNKDTAMYAAGKSSAYTEFLAFLDSLQEEIPTDLEEAAEEYSEGIIGREDAFMCKAAFIAGAEWQKRQMLKDAISCEVYWYDGPILNYPIVQLCEVLSKMGVDEGDKVRIVVLKEEE